MSAQVIPTVPPRPARSQQVASQQGVGKLPDIPPRPINKRIDRSISPANFPRSPLNEPWSANLSRQKTSERESLPRPPSVQNLPSIGQEGMEYAEIMDVQTNQQPPTSSLGADAAAQTRNIGQDLKLYAPKPSLPKSSATAQVQAVTRTDSTPAPFLGVAGFGKPPTPSIDENDHLHQVRTRSSFSRPGSAIEGGRPSTEGSRRSMDEGRRLSIYGDEQGPAELGLRVPINPLLGDVQAPSPAPHSPHTTGNNTEKRRSHHSRTKSGRETFAPPGSYGLHSHGQAPQDKFEKDWYAKHPEVAQFEETHGHGVYESIGSGRGSFALSSDDLNQIVRNTASRASNLGTSSTALSYPDEQVGYTASELFSRSQQNTPNSLARTVTNTSQPATESPLRKASFPADETIPAEVRRGRLSISGRSDDAIDSEAEQEVHIEPKRRYNKVTGGEESLNETRPLRSSISHPTDEDNYINEHGYSVPILAEDEVAKEVGISHMQPAVSPKQERHSSFHDDYRGEGTPGSRPSSRPTSLYGSSSNSNTLQRFVSHHDDRENQYTPLEDVTEYEPLFPEDDGQKPISHAERFKQRPNALKQRFPSQDIWEDTPSSALYSATVSTPDLPEQVGSQGPDKETSKTFETSEQEHARKGEATEADRQTFAPREERLAKSVFAPHLRNDMQTRPGAMPRFPSSDIWEDSPESHHLVTTVSAAQTEDEPDSPAEATAKPMVPPRPGKSRIGEGASSAQEAPSVPARPDKEVHAAPPFGATLTDSQGSSPTELKKVPSIPGRPKPQIPARPKKPAGDVLTKRTSQEAAEPAQDKVSPPLAKVKPQVPARPGTGPKIANLRGSFMNDLNQKLGLGPPKEKEPEPVEETKTLDDARKSRARGPQRRAPARSPAASTTSPPTLQFSMFKPHSLWTIDDTDEINVTSISSSKPADEPLQDALETTGVSDPKSEQLKSATVADSPLPPPIETTDHEPSAKDETTPSSAATDSKTPEPTLGTPNQEKSNPLSQKPSVEDVGLSNATTASSGQADGPELEREQVDPSTDAIPASKQTTASTDEGSAPLEKTTTHDPETETFTEPRLKGNVEAEGEPGKESAEQV